MAVVMVVVTATCVVFSSAMVVVVVMVVRVVVGMKMVLSHMYSQHSMTANIVSAEGIENPVELSIINDVSPKLLTLLL